ncbi:MAG: DinB family protein [Vicinamibacterales bacterium]
MSISVELRELLEYSDHERRKWRDWIAARPERLRIPFQAAGSFPTIESLFDHIFLVERRHLSRLEGGTPPDSTGVKPDDWKALFEYADLVRADLRRYIEDLDDTEARATMTIVARSGTQTMTKRRLCTHILLHEVRHLAQIAYAARQAAQEPPGQHDLFYFKEE